MFQHAVESETTINTNKEETTMHKKHTKQELFWLALTVLSVGTLSGCEYCAPIMLALVIGNIAKTAAGTIIESLQIQPSN